MAATARLERFAARRGAVTTTPARVEESRIDAGSAPRDLIIALLGQSTSGREANPFYRGFFDQPREEVLELPQERGDVEDVETLLFDITASINRVSKRVENWTARFEEVFAQIDRVTRRV